MNTDFRFLGGHQIESEGRIYFGGCLPRESRLGEWFPEAGATDGPVPLVPEKEWKTQELIRAYEWDDIDQGNTPACCLASTCNLAELMMALMGMAKTPLDWYKAWKVLSGGRGGVAVDVALRYAMTGGLPLKDGSGVVVFDEVWDCPTWQHFVSGLQRGAVGILCHDVHAEAGTRVVMQNGIAYIDTRNSWGWGWGKKGWHPEPGFRADRIEIRTYGAYLLRGLRLRKIDATGFADAAQAA